MNVVKMFKSGQLYMQLCPKEKSLSLSFPEIKIITYLKLAMKYLPPTIIALFVWQYYMHAQMALIVITALFALSLPLQGIFWLGKRALSPLPLNLLGWYNRIKSQLIAKKIIIEIKNSPEPINFIEFIKLLNLANLHLGSYFGEDQNDNSYLT